MNPSSQVQNERQQRIMEYYPLVCIIARRLTRRFPGSEEAEFINVGVIGLIDAMDRFDSARGVPFRSYAEIRIRGAIVDSMRSVDWRPRSLRRKATWVSDAEDRFRQDQGRSPLREELAKILDITVEELDEIREATIPQPLISIHTPIHTESEATVGDQVALARARPRGPLGRQGIQERSPGLDPLPAGARAHRGDLVLLPGART